MGDMSTTIEDATSKANGHGSTDKLISSYYMEIEYLLERVQTSTSHYQALALERSATYEEVVDAYQQLVKILHPPYYKVRAAIADDLLERIDQAFNKVSQAFLVLSDQNKKRDYDKSLTRPRSDSAPFLPGTAGLSLKEIGVSGPPHKDASATASTEQSDNHSSLADSNAAQDAISISSVSARISSRGAIFSKPAEPGVTNRRRCSRLKLLMPAMVVGYGSNAERWQEVGKTIDVSRMGVGLMISRRVQHGQVLHLTLPMPTKLRSHGYSEPSYSVYAIVRRVEPASEGTRIVGLEFLSERPPAGYLKQPWSPFRTEKWQGSDRRREIRCAHSETVTIEYLDDSMQKIRRESAVTENVSPGGTRLKLERQSAESDLLRVTNNDKSFSSLAIVRNRYLGKDGCERLCLKFVETQWPI
jgi:curved DNA-binding protein CbpA